jgi:hypothetical protein
VTCSNCAAISPGTNLGTLTAGNNTWTGSGNFNWTLQDALGAAGMGGSLLNINGQLDVSGASGFTINVASFPSGSPPANLVAPTQYSWTIVETSGGIVGFNASNFVINPNPEFVNPFGTGDFGLSVVGNNLVLTFQPVPPAVTTLNASSLNLTSAVLNSSVNPNGTPALAWFQYGLNTNYGSFSATNILGSGTNAIPSSASIMGLTPLTTYHFCAVATNSMGLTVGADKAFTTLGPFQVVGITPQPGTSYLLQFSGSAGSNYTVQASTNLFQWIPLTNLPANSGGLFQFIDTNTNFPARFYRLSVP